ncbi:hypothetical protein AB0J81_22125 [Streptomyces bobili]|uniref:hypothetical protein n=1 Tax=Streptomyces bobili TaxID=67280 RepID=UPI003448B8CC
MTTARRITRHRRVRAARKPVIGVLAAAGMAVGAWYATAGAATTAPDLTPTSTTVTLAAKFPYLSSGYDNTREWTRTGTCTGTFTGTHLRLVDWNGRARSADKVVNTRITGDIAVLKDGTLTWSYAPVTPTYAMQLTGASPTATTLKVARLKP